ncbi:MAG: hypothetical protein KTR16_03855 [Acidiferrobacterales bacterium]|nr:hypothetical protein [Acidiferrobacterales bacterium]
MEELYAELKLIMSSNLSGLSVVKDKPGYFYLDTKKVDEKGKPYFFGMVKMSAKKVAYHLMPVYCEPSLLEPISAELKKRMQGKSCFNFTKNQPELLEELKTLTASCIDSYKVAGKI